jgi:hypothetical protein
LQHKSKDACCTVRWGLSTVLLHEVLRCGLYYPLRSSH